MKQFWAILSLLAATCCLQASPAPEACPCDSETDFPAAAQDCTDCCDSKEIPDCSCCIAETEIPEQSFAISPWRAPSVDSERREIETYYFAKAHPFVGVEHRLAVFAIEHGPNPRLRLALQQRLLL